MTDIQRMTDAELHDVLVTPGCDQKLKTAALYELLHRAVAPLNERLAALQAEVASLQAELEDPSPDEPEEC